jgi:uncharacterized protein YkwD
MPNKHKNFIAQISVVLLLFIVGIISFCHSRAGGNPEFTFVYVARASGIAPSSVIELTNSARTANGLGTLSENAQLSEAANAKAKDMLKKDYFAHTSPSGRDPWYWIKQAGYAYKAAGENLAINFTDANEQQSAWMKSATHRANILNTRYQEIGVAVVEGKIDGQNSIVTVELFGTPLYAVIDKPVAVPPVVQKAPAEIRGAETTTEETSVPTPASMPVLPEKIISQNTERVLPVQEAPWLDISFLVFATVLALSAFVAPIAFLVKAYEILVIVITTKNIKKAEEDIKDNQNSVLEYHLKL